MGTLGLRIFLLHLLFAGGLGSGDNSEPFLLIADNIRDAIFQVNVTSGSKFELPLGEMWIPLSVDYDPTTDYVYWSDRLDGDIKRARRDGSGREIIAADDVFSVYGLALDHEGGNMYWTDSVAKTISVARKDGSFARALLTAPAVGSPGGLALDPRNGLPKSDLNQNRTVLVDDLSSPNDIYVFTASPDDVNNGCTLSNGGCQDLCLARPNGRTCACRAFWELHQDGQTCLPPDLVSPSYLWLDHSTATGVTSLKMTPGNSSVIGEMGGGSLPVTVLFTSAEPSRIEAIDYDFQRNLIFWADTGLREIHTVDTQDNKIQSFSTLLEGISSGVEGLAVDWLNQNLYYTDGYLNWIAVVNYKDNPPRHHIIVHEGLERPRGIAVHPHAGLFWADTSRDVIDSCDLNGENREIYYSYGGTHFYDITTDGEWITATDWSDDSINFLYEQGNSRTYYGDGTVYGVEYFDQSRQPAGQTDCQVNNGGCSHTCVGDPNGHRCLCLSNFHLAEDNHTCIANEHTFSKALLVGSDSGILQLPHNFLELSEVGNWTDSYIVRGTKVFAMDFDYAGKMIFYTQLQNNGTQTIERFSIIGEGSSMTVFENGQGIEGIAVDWVASNLYWTERRLGRIHVSKLDGSLRKVLISNLDQPSAIIAYPEQSYVFWTEIGDNPKITRASPDGSNRLQLVSSETEQLTGIPTALAIDYNRERLNYDGQTDYVYWSDFYDEKIYRAKRDGSGKEVLIDNNVISLSAIDGLAIDYAGQNIYWTDWGTEIIGVARLDGTHAQAILSENLDWPNGIVLDPKEGIQSSDLDGTNRRTVVTQSDTSFHGLSLHSHDLFWTSTSNSYVGANSKYQSDQTTSRVVASGFSSLRGIAMYSPDLVTDVSNACSVSNGGCQDMCLARPGGRTCACRAYFHLQNDNITCAPPELKSPSYLWINEVSGKTLLTMMEGNSTIFRSPDVQTLPRTTVMSASSPSIIVSFDYDIRQGRIFWIDVGLKEIQQVDVNTGEVTTLKTGISAGAEVLAADWINQNLYYTDFNYNRITMVSYSPGDSSGNSHIITETGLDKPRGIAVDPATAFVFWSDWGQSPKIERSTLSGENRTVILDSDLGRPSGLSIDYVTNRLYFADTELDAIYACGFDGGNREQFYYLPGTHFYDITFDGEEIMASDWSNATLNFVHDSRNILAFDPPGDNILAVEFFDESRQPQIQSDCQVDNGGCQHTCVGDQSGYKCLCLPDYNLADDHRTCVKNGHLFTKALLVSTDEGILQFPHNLADLPGTADSKPTVLVRGEKAIYYTREVDDGTQSIQKYDLTTNSSLAIYTGGQGIEGLAVDWVASNIYWTEKDNGAINVARLDGSFRKVLVTGLDQPSGIAVQPEQKSLYWTETGSISRATLAGTVKEVIVSAQTDVAVGNPTGIAVDPLNSRLYWTDGERGTVMSSNLRGEDAEPYWSSNGGELFGMAFYKDFQFWTDRTNRTVSIGLRSTLEKTVQLQTTPHSVRVFDGSQQPLSRDPYSKEDFLLVADYDTGYIIQVNITSGSKITLPLQSTSPTALDYDEETDYVYWSDYYDEMIYRAKRDGSGKEVLIDNNVISVYSIDGLALDYAGQNIYWTDSWTEIIGVARLDGSHPRAIVSEDLDYPFGITLDLSEGNTKSDSDQTTTRVLVEEFSSLRGIAMYSPGIVTNVSNEIKSPSYLWIAEDDGETLLTMLEGNSSIIRDAQSAPRTTVMSASSPSIIVSFDYDIRQGRIFWIDSGLKEIQQVDMKTGDVTTLKTGISAGAEFLAADWVNQNLYYTDFNYNRITMVSYSSGDSNGNSHIITETGLDKPRGIAVDPATAFVFWTDWGQSPKIERSTLSGEDRTVIVDSDLGHPSGLVIDYVNSK
uniref:EGF-like domain-containing protein n=1 Tax=Branchiostoma floridae TaxID=7739 RepID=C3YJU0_BRAFL|eukprot:XP_002603386.1 hypothetical protein BRAFLDRAFT_80379 [Branchiostoma floridae]